VISNKQEPLIFAAGKKGISPEELKSAKSQSDESTSTSIEPVLLWEISKHKIHKLPKPEFLETHDTHMSRHMAFISSRCITPGPYYSVSYENLASKLDPSLNQIREF
jgi:hypothetical protein